ncbi:hypothetical protein [Fibrobacter sp.]|uniref:hypothetical protein n=1 Tax=Fibrobacter sp. TaxID=35828 RepID=UPI0025C3C68E|nr:hypothetical protein [Fibrobacter sp.]
MSIAVERCGRVKCRKSLNAGRERRELQAENVAGRFSIVIARLKAAVISNRHCHPALVAEFPLT